MKIKVILARWKASRILKHTRRQRRILRDRRRAFYKYLSTEFDTIDEAEKRSKGLRLFIAWSRPRTQMPSEVTPFELHPSFKRAA